MRTSIAGTILLVAFCTAQGAPVDHVVSSALMAGDSVTFNLDFIDPFGLPFFDVTVEARVSNLNETYSIPTQQIDYPPYYMNTYEGGWVFEEPTSVIEFFGRVEAETLLVTQSFRNTGNQFPPEMMLYADLADEPDGDTEPGNPGPWTDLTGSGITYSGDRIFANLRNAGGGWPTDNGGLDFYIYAFALYNPDNPEYTGTALVYCGIPLVLDPGLYTVNLQDSTFERIGDIDYQIQGTTLHMSCTIEDLLSDPGWTVWPPESGFALTGGLTLTISLFTPSLNDYTFPAAFVPQTSFLDLFENWPPEIEGSVNPVPEEYVEATVIYSDQDNNLPVEKTFYFDGAPHDMGSYDRDYFDEAMFEYRVDWPMEGGWHTYYFRFSDGVEVVETELDSVYLSPIGTDDETIPARFALGQNYPNPFNAQTSIQFELQNPGVAQIAIYDVTGNFVRFLVDGFLEAGDHSIVWDGTDRFGKQVSSGVYIYRIEVDDVTRSRRMLLLK